MRTRATIERVHPDVPDARTLMDALDAELHGRYPEAHTIRGLYPGDARNPRLIFLVAYAPRSGAAATGRAEEPVACGAVREIDAVVGEVKRMFVRPERRGQGLARLVLEALESYARREGYRTLRIETGTRQHEAVALYRTSGYRDIPPFGDYAGNPYSVCFEKDI